MKKNATQIVIYNIKLVKVMRASNYTDAEIAKSIGISLKDFLDAISSDEYVKSVYDNAQTQILNEIEKLFLENTLKKLASGDNTDAKWILERKKVEYQKTDKVDMNVTGIDEIIRGIGGGK